MEALLAALTLLVKTFIGIIWAFLLVLIIRGLSDFFSGNGISDTEFDSDDFFDELEEKELDKKAKND